jgi:hypothetical protein
MKLCLLALLLGGGGRGDEGERRLPESPGDATAWINSPPLSVAALRGHVVLVNVWTFG